VHFVNKGISEADESISIKLFKDTTMKFVGKFGLFLFMFCLVSTAFGQGTGNMMSESGAPLPTPKPKPLNGIVEQKILKSKKVLAYDTPRESDIMWQKRVWRMIDTREKMNLPFRYPNRFFFEILLDGLYDKENPIQAYRDEAFEEPLDTAELSQELFREETITTVNANTYQVDTQVVRNDINYDDIKRYRLTEMWYFDKGAGELKVRILGMAPLVPVYSEADDGRVIGERPLFWIHYPSSRDVLARESYFNEFNDASKVSWENVFEMRYFSSFIIKVSNVQDKYLRNMYVDERQQLLEADKLKQEIFNFEHDLWSY
jgi:gliding motility associated protien GldN